MKRSLDPSQYGYCKSPKIASKTPNSNTPNSKNNNNNDLSDDNRIKVCVRVRPMTKKEIDSGSKNIISVLDNNIMRFDPVNYEQTSEDQYQYHGKVYKAIGKKANKNLQYFFDRIFIETENNLTVYSETTKSFVEALLSGYNCSIFAYGSTGSGKTHTMLGSQDDPGVIFYTTMDLFEQMEKETERKLELSISYYEIYNEIIYDLLEPDSNQPLSVLEDGNKGVTIKNLSVHQPNDAKHVIEMLEFGNKNRKQHPTDSNSESSRSHAIFQITLRAKKYSDNQDMSIQVSKMNLIDLAGSERASTAYKTYRTKGLHREGGNINRSLLSLGNCITALSSNQPYVPYRSSKLTFLLRDSLGGNCKTLMIATISSSSSQYEEIHNTLLYAERAKGIQLNFRINCNIISGQTPNYKQIAEKLLQEKQQWLEKEKEFEKLKNSIQSVPIDTIQSNDDAIKKLNSLKNCLDNLFQQRMELRLKLLDCHHNLKLLDLRLLFRSYDNKKLQLLGILDLENQDNEKLLDTTKSTDGLLHSIHGQKLHYTNLKTKIQKENDDNESILLKYEQDLLNATNDDLIIKTYFQLNYCKIEKKEMDLLKKHQMKLIEELCSKYESNEDINNDLFGFIYKSYHILNGLGQLSDTMEDEFKIILNKFKGKKTVVWRDEQNSPTVTRMKDLLNLFAEPLYMNTIPFNNNMGVDGIDQSRKLVAIHDITPLLNKKCQSSILQQQRKQQQQNLGNTITKSRSTTINNKFSSLPLPLNSVENNHQSSTTRSSSSSSSYRNHRYQNNGGNAGGLQPYSSKINNNYWLNNNNNNNNKRLINGSVMKNNNNGRHYNNNNYHDNNENMVPSNQNNNNYSYNPNFRPRFRF